MNELALIFIMVVVFPLAGGLLFGMDRILTARLQNRIGPPLLQPFYDVAKLFGKSWMASNSFQLVSVSVYLAAMIASLLLLVSGQDMLVLLFVLALGHVLLILGGFSVKSPYSQLGSQREVLQLLSYEPLLVFMVVGAYLKTHSFAVSSVLPLKEPLLFSLPLFLLTQIIVLAINLHKSPFDISGSHHAHQELVRGIYTEFSGPQLAIIEIAHWYELVLLLGFIALLWHVNLFIGSVLALACFFLVILMDNVTARMTWRWMVRFTWTLGIGLAVVNLGALYLFPRLTVK
jgi:ech hydrogenase subunit B